MIPNLYVHFPFCRRKCSYCTLYSRVGASAADRAAYVAHVAELLVALPDAGEPLATVYFGGGSPGFCDLTPLARPLSERLAASTEFTVELHPLDVTDDRLLQLRDLGVNRISMGVQSLDDAVLAHMGRGYDVTAAARAFACVRRHFDNAGIDLIVCYPGEREEGLSPHGLKDWGLCHCSVYALQNERRLANVPDDETTMNRLAAVAARLAELGLERYEISNYAASGRECRHNLAVWRGEDYFGLGDGAAGRIGLSRTHGMGGAHPRTEEVTPEADEIERTIFRLRTREGLDAARHPEWHGTLDRFVGEGLLRREDATYYLTPRGAEVCDTILAELV